MALELEARTGLIIAAAIEVHRALGPGFVESVYQGALEIELRKRGFPFASQLGFPVVYCDEVVGHHRLDLFVFDEIVVELKAVRDLVPEHFAVVKSYLRAVGREHGLLLNFAKTSLEVRRVLSRSPSKPAR